MKQKLVCISPNEEVGGRIIKQPLTYMVKHTKS